MGERLTPKQAECLRLAHKRLGHLRILLIQGGRMDIALKTFGIRDDVSRALDDFDADHAKSLPGEVSK